MYIYIHVYIHIYIYVCKYVCMYVLMRHPWRHLNLGSKYILLNICMIAANTLNIRTMPFPSASAELRRVINRITIIIIIIICLYGF